MMGQAGRLTPLTPLPLPNCGTGDVQRLPQRPLGGLPELHRDLSGGQPGPCVCGLWVCGLVCMMRSSGLSMGKPGLSYRAHLTNTRRSLPPTHPSTYSVPTSSTPSAPSRGAPSSPSSPPAGSTPSSSSSPPWPRPAPSCGRTPRCCCATRGRPRCLGTRAPWPSGSSARSPASRSARASSRAWRRTALSASCRTGS